MATVTPTLEPPSPTRPQAALSEAPTIAPTMSNTSLPTAGGVNEKAAAPSSSSSSAGDDDGTVVAAGPPASGILQRSLSAASASPSAVMEGTHDGIERTKTREDGEEYPSGMKLGLITLALCLSVFLMALDNSIIATAIPKITDQFHSLQDVGWYGSAYLLTTASLQLLFGRFYTFFSIKLVYLIAIFLFEVGSLICGVAPNSVALIIGRAVAGVGSAGIFSGALIILAHSVPLVKRPMYTGLIGSMYGIASVSGPLLGGVFTDEVTWRWCFYINLPIGAVTVAVIAWFFPDPKRRVSASQTPSAEDVAAATATSGEKKKTSWAEKKSSWATFIWKFDPIGTIVFMPAVISLLLALQWGGTKYPWSSARIVALFVLAAVLLAVFVIVQLKVRENATISPRIFAKRTVWASAIFAFFVGAAFLCSIYFLPLWFQAVKNASAVRSGIMNLPMLIAVVLCSIGAGAAVTVWGYYSPFMIAGVVLMSIGYGLITTFEVDTSSGKWIGYQILAGAGVGLAMQQPLMAVQTVLDIDDVPTGTALIAFSQTLGGALFVSIGQTVFTNELVSNIVEHVPGLDPELVLLTGATSIQSAVPAQFLDGVVLAYNNALTRTFIVSAATAAMSAIGGAFVEWKSVKGKSIEMGVA